MRGLHGRHAGSGETATIKDANRGRGARSHREKVVVRRVREARCRVTRRVTPIDSMRSSRVLDGSRGSRTDVGR